MDVLGKLMIIVLEFNVVVKIFVMRIKYDLKDVVSFKLDYLIIKFGFN